MYGIVFVCVRFARLPWAGWGLLANSLANPPWRTQFQMTECAPHAAQPARQLPIMVNDSPSKRSKAQSPPQTRPFTKGANEITQIYSILLPPAKLVRTPDRPRRLARPADSRGARSVDSLKSAGRYRNPPPPLYEKLLQSELGKTGTVLARNRTCCSLLPLRRDGRYDESNP